MSDQDKINCDTLARWLEKSWSQDPNGGIYSASIRALLASHSELLAACQDTLDTYAATYDESPTLRRLVRRVKSAVKKAKGEPRR